MIRLVRAFRILLASAALALALAETSTAVAQGGTNSCRDIHGDGGKVAKQIRTRGYNCTVADELIFAYIDQHGDDGPGDYGDCVASRKHRGGPNVLRVRCRFDDGNSLSFLYFPKNRQ